MHQESPADSEAPATSGAACSGWESQSGVRYYLDGRASSCGNTIMRADARTNEELLDAARDGDEGALAVLVERHRDRLERMVRPCVTDSFRESKSVKPR